MITIQAASILALCSGFKFENRGPSLNFLMFFFHFMEIEKFCIYIDIEGFFKDFVFQGMKNFDIPRYEPR